jgi:DNA repair protein RadC
MGPGRTLATLRLLWEGPIPAPAGNTAPDARRRVEMRTPAGVYAFMTPFAAREVWESFWVIALNDQDRVQAPTVITRGILNTSLAHFREVFHAAILAGAVAVILVHNHQIRDPTPSQEGYAATEQLVAAGRRRNIPEHDQVIVSCGRYA